MEFDTHQETSKKERSGPNLAAQQHTEPAGGSGSAQRSIRNRSNSANKPLSDDPWLEVHNAAKETERRLFAQRVAALRPSSIADLGCGPGFWLEHLHHELPLDCVIWAIDVDEENLEVARSRAEGWDRHIEFVQLDFDRDPGGVPSADVTLMFNLLSYLRDPRALLLNLLERKKRSIQVIRNWDGATIRFGPMEDAVRISIDRSLRTSVGTSDQFNYFAMDGVLRLLNELPYTTVTKEFEKFERFSPFSPDVLSYLTNTIDWTYTHCSSSTQAEISEWLESLDPRENKLGSYFVELDLVAFAS